jgi:hypothetical protein
MTQWFALPVECDGCHSQTPHRTTARMRQFAEQLPPDEVVTHFICQHEVRPRVRCKHVVLIRAADYAHAVPSHARPPRLNTSASRWLNGY